MKFDTLFMPRVFFKAEGTTSGGTEPTSNEINSVLDLLAQDESDEEEQDAGGGGGSDEGQRQPRKRKEQAEESEDDDGTEESEEEVEETEDADADADAETEAEDADDKSQRLPPIEAPASWKADAKKEFDALPRKVQQVIADRESEREGTLTRTQQEAAEHRKTADTERGERQKERAEFAKNIGVVIDNAVRTNPILQEAQKLSGNSQNLLEGPGWLKLLNDNPDVYHKMQANTRYVLGEMSALQRARVEAEGRVKADTDASDQKLMKASYDKLTTEFKLDSQEKWSKFDTETSNFLTTNGFPPEVVGDLLKTSWGASAVKIVRWAMERQTMLEQQAKIPAAKKVPQQKTRAAPSRATTDVRDRTGSDRTKAILKKADGARNDRDLAGILANLV